MKKNLKIIKLINIFKAFKKNFWIKVSMIKISIKIQQKLF